MTIAELVYCDLVCYEKHDLRRKKWGRRGVNGWCNLKIHCRKLRCDEGNLDIASKHFAISQKKENIYTDFRHFLYTKCVFSWVFYIFNEIH